MLRPFLPRLALAGLAAVALALPAGAEPPQVPELPEGWDVPTFPPQPGSDTGLFVSADEIAGGWRYETANQTLIACDFPVWPLDAAAGDIEIAPHDGIVTATLVTGSVCSPDSMCLFDGTLEEGVLTMANRDTVDAEGGIAANGWAVAFSSGTRAEGSGTSAYVHPRGERCLWSYTVTLTR